MSDTQNATRRLRRWPAAVLDRHCARRRPSTQAGTKKRPSTEQRNSLLPRGVLAGGDHYFRPEVENLLSHAARLKNEERPSRSEPRTLSKTKNNYLTGKPDTSSNPASSSGESSPLALNPMRAYGSASDNRAHDGKGPKVFGQDVDKGLAVQAGHRSPRAPPSQATPGHPSRRPVLRPAARVCARFQWCPWLNPPAPSEMPIWTFCIMP